MLRPRNTELTTIEGNQQLRSIEFQNDLLIFGDRHHDDHAHLPSKIPLAFRLQDLLIEI